MAVGGSQSRHRIIVLETIPRYVVTIEVRRALYGSQWSIGLTEMTTRVSVATQFSGMANPAPVELLAAGNTNPARIIIIPPARVIGDRRREPCLPLFGWWRRPARPSRRRPSGRLSLGGPGGEAHPPSPALVPQQQLPQLLPPR